jgi:hypothetical protein
VYPAFFREEGRLTNNYGDVGPLVFEIIAKVNPHFGLSSDDYWNMNESELLCMVEEFDAYNRKVQKELKKK